MARILVIDDDRSLLKMMKLMLERAGHVPILADSGKAGIQTAIVEQPDLIIVDVMMPELSGYDVCRQLREEPATVNIPLMILTARSQPMDLQMAVDAGADDYITKPVTRDDLIEHLARLLVSGATNFPSRKEQESDGDKYASPVTNVFYPDQPVSALPIIAVMALRGGSGATTVAVNLALGMMQHGRSSIVDLGDVPGHVAVQLRMLPPRASWLNLINAGPKPDANLIGASLMLHSSQVAVMAGPTTATSEQLSAEAWHHVLTVLTEGFKRIVVDLPVQMDTISQAVLRMAAHVVLVVSDDLAILQTAAEELRAIDALGLTAPAHIVLNRTRPGGVSFLEAQQALGRLIAFELPYEATHTVATARGLPLVMSAPMSPFSQAILQLAAML